MAAKSVTQILDGIDATIEELNTFITTQNVEVDNLDAQIQALTQEKDALAAELQKAHDNVAKLQEITSLP